MPEKDGGDSALGPYRALDLTEGGFNWCGKVLADLGADVIKVEPPGGSFTRYRGPFYKDSPHPERSLFWYSYCLNKRGITLDLECADGRELFKKLVSGADFVLESFAPGYMGSLGLGYESLSSINPGLVMVSMSPFGQTGPRAEYKATDIVGWSMGGMQYLSGDDDRPPVRVSFPQAELHAGAQAAAGAMVAFWQRQRTGHGQQVDVSMQEAVIWTLMNATAFPQLHKVNLERAGAYRKMGFLTRRAIFPCSDGYVSVAPFGGVLGAGSIEALVRWMDEEGAAPAFMKDRDWYSWDVAAHLAQGEEGLKDLQSVEQHVGDFLASKTKAELYERAIADKILLAPCNTLQDVRKSPQLEARGFWVDMYHSELNTSLTYLGPYIKLSETPIKTRRRAPLIGEHNDDIYIGELGLTVDQMAQLKAQGII